MTRRADPVRRLLRVLAASAAAEGCAVELAHLGACRWASATFEGARHRLAAKAEPVALARWLAMLPEAELPLHGWFVASCAAEVAGGNAMVELLVLEA